MGVWISQWDFLQIQYNVVLLELKAEVAVGIYQKEKVWIKEWYIPPANLLLPLEALDSYLVERHS